MLLQQRAVKEPQHGHTRPQQLEELDQALEKLGGGRFQLLLLSCICSVWAGAAAEVMVLTYLGPAVSIPQEVQHMLQRY
jgi:hypothetical protein